ncbi:MAG: PEFG-CTERM sorting domain-containing protein, partial [Nitrosarchaeum sp.]
KMELAITQNNPSDFLSWSTVMEKKFSLSEKYPEINSLISGIKSNSKLLSTNGPQITEKLLEIFKLKTVEELEEAIAALEKGDIQSAKTFTHEGLYYYRTLHPAVEKKIGSESANKLLQGMESALSVSMSGKSADVIKADIQRISEEVEVIIRAYEGGNTSEVGLALSGIKDRLNLVQVEYSDAVKNGKIIDQEEYDESVIFLAKATDIFNVHKAALTKISNSDTVSLGKNLVDIKNIITVKGNPDEVSAMIDTSLTNIASFEELLGGETQIDILKYFDEIDKLLNQAKISYRNGDTKTAFDLATRAYLDNYEFIEGPLGEIDPVLVLKIETAMRVDLRNMIKSNESADKVDAQIDMILSDLAQARNVIPEFGTIAMVILSVALISIIGMTAKSRLSIRL